VLCQQPRTTAPLSRSFCQRGSYYRVCRPYCEILAEFRLLQVLLDAQGDLSFTPSFQDQILQLFGATVESQRISATVEEPTKRKEDQHLFRRR
jgi:hypothetical protein